MMDTEAGMAEVLGKCSRGSSWGTWSSRGRGDEMIQLALQTGRCLGAAV